jgi:hypothetical protein
MSTFSRLRRFATWTASTLEMSATGCYAVAEFAAPCAELQGHAIALPRFVAVAEAMEATAVVANAVNPPGVRASQGACTQVCCCMIQSRMPGMP